MRHSGFAGIALAAGLALSVQGAAAQETYVLRLANFASAGGAGGQMLQTYAAELEEASGGRLKIEVFHGSSMGPAAKHFDLARTGVADLAYFTGAYTPGRFPVTDIFALPNVVANADTSSAATEIMMTLAPEHLFGEYDGVKVIWLAAVLQDRIFTAGTPVKTLDDLRGLQLRVAAKSSRDVLQEVGAVPLSMPAGEVPDALQKNAIDGVHASRGTVWTIKMGDLLRYETPLLKSQLIVGFVINQRVYDSLPDDLQALIDGLGGIDGAVRYVRALEEDNPVVTEYYEGSGIETIEPDPALVDAVAEAAEELNAATLSRLDAEGPRFRAFYDRVRELDAAGGS